MKFEYGRDSCISAGPGLFDQEGSQGDSGRLEQDATPYSHAISSTQLKLQ